ncbi:hypothetical protein M0657_005022 [Pyricularia oryzae]|nr:hypothetical protein M0657_005022 [Pyricularia oryzae]
MTSPQTLHLIPVWSVWGLYPRAHTHTHTHTHTHPHTHKTTPKILISWASSAS